MTKTALKKKITDCIANINDEKVLEAVYILLNERIDNQEYELSQDDLKIIEARRKAILKGEEKTYTVSQVKRKLLKDLGKQTR
jgi:hypothetical protein